MAKKNSIAKICIYLSIFALFFLTVLPLFKGEFLKVVHPLIYLIFTLIAVKYLDFISLPIKALLVLVLIFNAIGWVFDLYQTIWFYDEVAHAITPFIITLVFGSWTQDRYKVLKWHPMLHLIVLTSVGIAIGTLWEMAEWVVYVIAPREIADFTLNDTFTDLILDSLGSFIAAFLMTGFLGFKDMLRGIIYSTVSKTATLFNQKEQSKQII